MHSEFVPGVEAEATVVCILDCCHVCPSTAELQRIRDFWSDCSNKDASNVIDQAMANGVLPLVYHAVAEHAAEVVSVGAWTALKHANIKIVVQNMQMAAELSRLQSLLKDNDVPCLAFKGPALAQLAYGDTGLRQFSDLDILIQKRDLARVMTLLRRDGYVAEIEISPDREDTFFSHVNVIGLSKSIHIEIHWELMSKNYAIEWQEATMWAHETSVSIDDIAVPMLPYNTHLLYLCAHGAKHLFERLEWVCDIDRLLRSNPDIDWEAIRAEAQARGIERMLMLGLYLCHYLLALPLPDSIHAEVLEDSKVSRLGQDIIALNFTDSAYQGKSLRSFVLLWRMRERYTDQLRFAWRAIFAPKFDDFNSIQLPAYLGFLYPLLRPIRLMIKYLKA